MPYTCGNVNCRAVRRSEDIFILDLYCAFSTTVVSGLVIVTNLLTNRVVEFSITTRVLPALPKNFSEAVPVGLNQESQPGRLLLS